jgi:adenylate cyclase
MRFNPNQYRFHEFTLKSVILLLLLFPLTSFSQNVVWNGNTDVMEIANKITYIEDEANKITIADLLKPNKHEFKANPNQVLTFGSANRHYWLKIEIENNSTDSVFLELQQQIIPFAAFYTINENAPFHLIKSGSNVPLYDKIVKHHTHLFPIKKGKNQYLINTYIYGQSVPVKLWKKEIFEIEATKQKIFFGIYTGLIIFVVINNLLLFLSLRTFTYLHYSVLAFIYWLQSATFLDGYIRFVFPTIDMLNWYIFLPIVQIPNALIYCIFFLNLKKYTPKYYKFAIAFLIYITIYLVVCMFLPLKTVLNINIVNSLMVLLIIPFLSWQAWRNGNKIGFYFGLAYFAVFLSVFIETMYILTGQPSYLFKVSHVSIGIFLEVFILSIALSKRFEWEKHENIQGRITAQNQLLEKTQENEKIVREQNQMLEEQVLIRTMQLNESKKIAETERQKSDALLLNILPAEIAEELRQTGTSTALNYELATVLFADIKDFTRISTQFSAETMVKELDYIFGAFDKIIENHNIEKIKIIGDAYMCAGGLPISNKTNAFDVVNAALDIQEFMKNMRKERVANNQQTYEIRIGINSGPLVAGIIGIKKFTYDIWGDTVNLASRLETNGEVNKINISENTYNLIKDVYDCEYRGKIEVKGKGNTAMYFIHGRKNHETNFDLIEKKILKMLKNGLSTTLYYHGYPHTIDVINNVKYIAEKENITKEDIHLLKMAALFHDLGFLEAYTGHEAVGCKMAREMLPQYAVPNEDIEQICAMIMTTKVPQTPKTLLEKILCDADLLYLGTDDFDKTGNSLFTELKENGKLKTMLEWNQLQAEFLKKHKFHTQYMIENYTKKKEENLAKIKNWLKNNK